MGQGGSSHENTIWKACNARQQGQIIELSKSINSFLRPPPGTETNMEHFDFDANFEDVLDLENADPKLARRKAELVPNEVSVCFTNIQRFTDVLPTAGV
jgi:hypothetical protein